MFTLYWIAFHVGWYSIVWTVSNGANRTGTSRSYTSNIVPEPFKVKVWWTNSCSLLMNIYFRLSGLQSSFLFIHFSEGPNTCFTPHHSLDTEAIRYADAPPSRLTGRNFAPKSPLVCVNWNRIRYSSRTGAKDIQYCVNIAGSYSPRHAQSLANGRAGNEAQEVVQSFPRVFAPSSHLPLCCPFSLSTLTFHVGQDVELGRVVVGSFAEFSTDPNFLVLLFKDGDCTERSLA